MSQTINCIDCGKEIKKIASECTVYLEGYVCIECDRKRKGFTEIKSDASERIISENNSSHSTLDQVESKSINETDFSIKVARATIWMIAFVITYLTYYTVITPPAKPEA